MKNLSLSQKTKERHKTDPNFVWSKNGIVNKEKYEQWKEDRRQDAIKYNKLGIIGFDKGHIPWNKGLGGKGICKAWNKSLTKETDSRIKSPWNKGLTIETSEKLKKATEKMTEIVRKQFENGRTQPNTKPKILFICPICGEQKYLCPSEAKNRKYCGKECSGIARRGKPSWNKGLTAETDERIRKGTEKMKKYNLEHPMTIEERERRSIAQTNKVHKNKFKCHYKGGFRKDIGHFVRSTWEANICRTLNFLNEPYEYEKHVFKLEEGRRYVPDLYLPNYGLYIEIKAYMSEESKQKLTKFFQKYPDETLIILDGSYYKEIKRQFQPFIKKWEEEGVVI